MPFSNLIHFLATFLARLLYFLEEALFLYVYCTHIRSIFQPWWQWICHVCSELERQKNKKQKTNRSTETSILYCCYNGTIKRKQLDIKHIHALCSCVLLVVLLFSVVIVVWVLPTVTVLPHLISFLFFLTRLAKQNKQAEEDCSFHTINGSVCLVQ